MKNVAIYFVNLILLTMVVLSGCKADDSTDPKVEETSAQVEITVYDAQESPLESVKV